LSRQNAATVAGEAGAIEAYAQTLATLGLDAGALALGSRGTLATAAVEGAPHVQSLPYLTGDATRADEVRLQALLGEGGMGQVFAAEQVSLQREVAVKRVRPGDAGRDALLREALVTGRLEHPGIVPVHLLGQTPEGAPLFVMKRVEGVTWAEALAMTGAASTVAAAITRGVVFMRGRIRPASPEAHNQVAPEPSSPWAGAVRGVRPGTCCVRVK
jgi:hypothetical protein